MGERITGSGVVGVIGLLVVVGGSARAESLCDAFPADELGLDMLFVAPNVNAEGEFDGSIGVTLPEDLGEVEWAIAARVHFEGVDVQWDVGPFTGRGGEYFEWFVEVPPDAWVLPDQTSHLSDLLIRVILRVDGVEVQRASPGYLRVAFSDESEPLVMLPTQAEDLAPGGAWASTATPRSSSADLADVERPPSPVDEASSQHSEEVDG